MEITLDSLVAYSAAQRSAVVFTPTGEIQHAKEFEIPAPISRAALRERIAASEGVQIHRRTEPIQLHAEGYEHLAAVLQRAFEQAASGKGKERHAQGEPFTEQVMQDMARRFGVGALLGQAFKKSEESQRLPHDKAVAELLGAINYLAGAVIAMERRGAHVAPPANDNAPCCAGGRQTAARCTGCIESIGLQAEHRRK